MITFLIIAWLFLIATFCALGGVCAISSRLRSSITGQYRYENGHGPRSWGSRALPLHCGGGTRSGRLGLPRRSPGSGTAVPRARPGRVQAGSRSTSLEDLQQDFVDGMLSVEQYEREVDRLLGLAS